MALEGPKAFGYRTSPLGSAAAVRQGFGPAGVSDAGSRAGLFWTGVFGWRAAGGGCEPACWPCMLALLPICSMPTIMSPRPMPRK